MQASQPQAISHLNALQLGQEGRTKGKTMRRKRDANRKRGREGQRERSIVWESRNEAQMGKEGRWGVELGG